MKRLIGAIKMGRRFQFNLLIFVISCCMFSTNSYGGRKMEPAYLYEVKDFKEAKTLEQQVFAEKTSSSLSLFPVPQDNTIGTNDMNNAITLISFPKGRISFDKHFKNALEQVGGGGEFIPVISPDTIGFGQTRRFVLYNFKTKKHERFRIAASIEESIQKIAIASAWQKHFIFEIKEYDRKSEDHSDYTSTLQLMDLSGQEPRLVKNLNISNVTIWSVINGKNFLYDLKSKQLQVLNMNLEPSHHPLADEIKRNKGKIDFTRLHSHPTLPFAILYGGSRGSTFISWGNGRNNTPHLLISGVDQFTFSPDGKWVVFKYERSEPEKTYLMPVSEKYPNFLGSPILISNNYFNENNFGWTHNPVSFVGSNLDKIYRWDLENRDFPEKGKMSFHDYIVQEDLKKLTEEKRQGLGGKQK